MEKAIHALCENNLVVMRTDTLYGIVAPARNTSLVERIYQIKGRDDGKPLIILISDLDQLRDFGVLLDPGLLSACMDYWPGKVSIIFDIPKGNNELEYLHRGGYSLAFRFPEKENLRKIIQKVGPLVAPSANPQGMPPAMSINQAKEYFGDSVGYYFDEGEVIDSSPSRIIKILPTGEIKTLR